MKINIQSLSLSILTILCINCPTSSVSADEKSSNFSRIDTANLTNSKPSQTLAFRNRTISLTGQNLTTNNVIQVAKHGTKVSISKEASERVQKSHEILLLAAQNGHQIYGLTVGVGLNKDQAFVDSSGSLDEEVIRVSKEFNRNLIYAHSAGAGLEMTKEVVRAIMVTRLNAILFGSTGARLEVAELYHDFINNDIIPVVPSRGD